MEVAGRVWIPEIWGQEELLKDWTDCSAFDAPLDFHVLAVNDNHVNHKVIEHLLKIYSCKVTVVDSGTRALKYLGLDGVENSIGFNSAKVAECSRID
ncbi:hypothetical protein K1719_000932 [Acacia pycnantha]|nr:hypothetical protein K1719_000932 [Acacia pycnantha]